MTAPLTPSTLSPLYFDMQTDRTIEMWVLRSQAALEDDPSLRILEESDLWSRKIFSGPQKSLGCCVFPFVKAKDTSPKGCVHELYASVAKEMRPEILADAFDLFAMAARNMESPIFPISFTGYVFAFHKPLAGVKMFEAHAIGVSWYSPDLWSVVAWIKDGKVLTIHTVEHTTNAQQFQNAHVLFMTDLYTGEQLKEKHEREGVKVQDDRGAE